LRGHQNKRRFYQRIEGLLDPAELASRKVVVVGVGSGGSRVAAELGRLGLQLLLIERPKERLEEHNIVRHVLGYESLGKRKLPETIAHIRKLNPSARLSAKPLDVVEDKSIFARCLARWRPDLIAVCTDNEQSKHAVNQIALSLGIPQVGAGVYDGGIGGEVYRVGPGQACYGCLAQHLQLQRYTPAELLSHDYNTSNAEQAPSPSALNLDIEQIALLQCRMALDMLFGNTSMFLALPPQVNLLVFANRVVPGTFERPLHAEFFSVPAEPDCLECGRCNGGIEGEASRILSALRTAEA